MYKFCIFYILGGLSLRYQSDKPANHQQNRRKSENRLSKNWDSHIRNSMPRQACAIGNERNFPTVLDPHKNYKEVYKNILMERINAISSKNIN